MVRFTTSTQIGHLSTLSEDIRDTIATEIGKQFEMIVITGGADFCSYGVGKCEGKARQLFNFLASDLAAQRGVSTNCCI